MSTTVDVLAHGLGGRTDLPLNGSAAIIGGGIAVAVSFVALAKLWSRPWLDPERGRPLPRALAALADSRAFRTALRLLVLLAWALVVTIALTGPAGTDSNLAPWVLYVVFWVGLVPASLLGPVWRIANPLRTLHRMIDFGHRRPLPEWLGHWPAAAWLAGFVWLELVAPGRSDPRLVGWLLVGYAVVNLVAAFFFGPAWFTRGDGFEVYSTLVSRMSPFGRRSDGTLILRNPLAGLVATGTAPGLAAVACVLIGSTGFDGLTRTTYWQAVPDPTGLLAGTLGLALSIAVVSALYTGSLRVSAMMSHTRDPLPGLFAATLLPIAVGYSVAHYFSFLLLEGQMAVILASDPFGTGLDLLGSRGNTIDYGLVSPELVAMVQINAIVLGHIASTAAAHDQALRLFPARQARLGQLPVVLAMVALTCTGLLLLLSG